jgi:hypothetical protein
MMGRLRPALAAEPAPSGAPVSTGNESASPSTWRRWALPAALAGTGLALAGTVGAMVLRHKRISEFNSYGPRTCNANSPGRGAPRCAELYEGGQNASLWAKVGLVSSGAFAATALVLWITSPKPVPAPKEDMHAPVLSLSCAPGVASASCTLTF